MNRNVSKIFSQLFAIGVLVIICYTLYKIIHLLFTAFSEINATLAACTTIFVSIVSILISKHIEHKTTIRNEQRAKVIPFYEDFIDFVFRLTHAEKLGKEPIPEIELMEKMKQFTRDIIVWGSDDVIKAYFSFRKKSILAIDNPELNIMYEVENLFLAIRKDLGHKNKSITKGTLLNLFINDMPQ